MFRALLLIILPVDEAAACRDEQDHRTDQPTAILLRKIAGAVATQILVDLANEGVADIRGLRQRRASVRSIGIHLPALPSPLRFPTQALDGATPASIHRGWGRGRR